MTNPATPQENSVAERTNQTLTKMSDAAIKGSPTKLPETAWQYSYPFA
jgi:hypothetical protein